MITNQRFSLQGIVSNARATYGSPSSHSFMQNTNVFTYLHRVFLGRIGGNWFISGNSNTTLTKGFGLYANSASKNFRFYTMTGAGYSLNADVSPTVPIIEGKWNNFLVRCDGTNFKMYNFVDGKLYQFSGTVAGAPSSGDSGTAQAINSYNSVGSSAFQGAEHSELAIWNTDIGEVAALNLLRRGIIPSTPFTWFRFNNGDGSTITDFGSGATNGTIQSGTMRWSSHSQVTERRVPYPDNQSGEFPSAANGTLAHAAAYNPANMSAFAWVKWLGGATYNGILSKTTTGSWTDGYGMYLLPSGSGLILGTWIGNWGANVISKHIAQDYPANSQDVSKWIHVGFTYDGVTLKQYVNGLINASLAVASPAVSTADLRLATITGGYPFGTATIRNKIGRVVMSNVALTDSEVLDLYLRGFQPRSCIGDWRWTHESTFTSLKDYSSLNTPFTLTGVPAFALTTP